MPCGWRYKWAMGTVRALRCAILCVVITSPARGHQASGSNDKCSDASSIGGQYGYKDRGDRCEGLVNQALSSAVPPLALVALYESGHGLSQPSSGRLSLLWDPSAVGPTTILARSNDWRTPLDDQPPYRMRAVVTIGHRFELPSNILQDLRVFERKLGVIATTDESGSSVYLPLLIGSQPGHKSSGVYLAGVMPSEPIRNLTMSIRTIGQLRDREATSVRPVPVVIPLSDITFLPLDLAQRPAGLYRVEISGEGRSGRTTLPFTIRHSIFIVSKPVP